MPGTRTSHAVYATKYHLVWIPKYRQWIDREDIRRRIEQVLRPIADDSGVELDELEVAKDHIHIFLNFPPRYAIATVVGIVKSLSASRLLKEFPELGEQLWKGEFWEEGYLVRTVRNDVTAAVIRRYIRYHRHEEQGGIQLKLL